MKRILLILLFLISLGSSSLGQVITTSPEFPTPDESVTIRFDATQGTAGLEGYTGDVYAHTGVITGQSTSGSDWRYVVAEWGENIPKARMERVGDNIYELEITPSIREYYGVPENETIEEMAFVFRSGQQVNGSYLEGKAEGGADIFAQVYQSTFNVKFVQPGDTLTFRRLNESLNILGIGSSESGTIELSLLIDGQQVQTVTYDTLNYTYQAQAEGSYRLALAGTNGTERDTAYATLAVYPEPTDQDRPSDLKDGITYVDENTVRLSLFAPHKEFVYLLGDFNNWQVDSGYFMNRDEVNADSTYFWIEVNGLNPGQEYAFQYLVDGDIRVADPYSEKVLDPNNDASIPESIYPNLKQYPHGKTEHLIGVLQPGQQPFGWQHTDYDRPDKENLVIYELLMRDFLEQHDYQTLTDTLDYLDRLGVNAIELMPVMEFEGNNSWGYNPALLFAVDKYYGPAGDLKRFIDEAHSRGIAVILDIVLNHVYGQSPLVRLWNEGTYGQPTPENPYLNVQSPNQTYSWGYDFNHASAATRYYVDRVTRYWIEEYKADGYRFDFTKGFTQTPGDGWPYDADRIRNLKRMADQQWAVDDSSFVILEHLTVNQEEQELSDYGMLLWGNMNYSYNEATMGYHDSGNSDFSGISYSNRGWNHPHLVGYMESHDEERLMFKNLQYGNSNSSGSYDITELSTALNRTKMAAAFFFTVPGPKMIWQFGELGYDKSINLCEDGTISDACRLSPKPVLWEYYSDQQRKRLYGTFKALIRLRNTHPAFTSEESEIELDVTDATKNIRISHPEMEVSIAGNFGVAPAGIQPGFSQSGSWYDFFSGDTLSVSDPDTSISYAPGEFHIYTTTKFEQPEGNLLSGIADDGDGDGGDGVADTFKLYQNYPNPFNPTTTIPYDLPQAAEVTLEVYNILGRKVLTRDLGQQTAGENKEIQLDFSGLSSGIYLYRLQAGSQVSTKKMVLIK